MAYGEVELLNDVDVLKNDCLDTTVVYGLGIAGASGEDNDGDVGGLGAGLDGGDQFGAVHLRHLQIGDDDIRRDVAHDLECFVAIGGGLDEEAALFEVSTDGVTDEHGVVNDDRHTGHTGLGLLAQ